ncbi:MAG: hypothetical protein RIQ90_67 [Bacteroidota bacterium]|jgi:hypothetical protein
MKNITALLFSVLSTLVFSQKSEALIPSQSSSVFSINNLQLLEKISVDELITYDFMEDIHQELFDGSTEAKSLNDAGIDFDQRINIFFGKDTRYEITGFTFGIKDKKALFSVFDDFDFSSNWDEKTEIYSSLFNHLVIQNNAAMLIRVEPVEALVTATTDSIWYARGNLSPYSQEAQIEDASPDDDTEETEFFDLSNSIDYEKNYNELLDSVQFYLKKDGLDALLKGVIDRGERLVNHAPAFNELLTHPVAGVFYIDNARNLERSRSLWYLKTILPRLFVDMKEIYEGNLITGDLILRDHAIDIDVTAQYGQKLGEIYTEMEDSKFDPNILKYIRSDHPAFFTYNINLRKAYEKAFEILIPILSKQKNERVIMNVLVLKLLDELINKDALFKTYKGSLFMTFNGVKKVKTKKVEFKYDENTFEYTDVITDAEEDMPVFTMGFSTERGDIPEMILTHLSQIASEIENKGDYWVLNKAVFNAAPMFMTHRNGLFIVSNDQTFIENNLNGYGEEALTKKSYKRMKKGGSMNGVIDLNAVAEKLPVDFFPNEQQRLIESLKETRGQLALHSERGQALYSKYHVNYRYEGAENSGKHLLDLLNTVFLFTK